MDVWVPVIATFVSVLGAIAVAWFTHRQGRRDVRTMIKSDAEALKLLKEINPDSPGVTKLASHIDWRIEQLAATERDARRDWPQIFAVLLVEVTAVMFTVVAIWAGSWWRLLLVPAVFLCMVGFAGSGAFLKKVRET